MKSLVLKAITFIVFTAYSLANYAFAQEVMQSVGTTISALTGTIQNQYGSSGFGVEQIDLTYFPHYNFIENDNSSVSIGAPVSAGLELVAMSINGGGEVAFSYDLPVVLDYNIGFKSSTDNNRTFGVYFGADFGFNQVTISKSNSLGYDGIFYKKGMEKEKMSGFGFNVLMDI